jgi:hypothetical protein
MALSRHEIADVVVRAGGIFSGVWETPAGRFVTVTEPDSLSTFITPVAGISVASVEAGLARVRRRFTISTVHVAEAPPV